MVAPGDQPLAAGGRTHRGAGGAGDARGDPGPAWALALFFAVVTASHGVLDALTNGGLGVAFLAPFDGTRHFLPWRPVEVSPLGRAFFSPWGLRVLASEAAWIWLPMAGVVIATRVLQRAR